MPTPDVHELARRYSLHGFRHWGDADPEVKRRAMNCLSNRIADEEWHIHDTLRALSGEAPVREPYFIPMPGHPATRGCDFAFFLPLRNGAGKITFELFLLVRDSRCLGFRLEPADSDDHRHNYPHLQMNVRMIAGTVPACTPDWVPQSYPAFPTGTLDSLEAFLYLATAVHGYAGGIDTVLDEVFKGQRPRVQPYLRILEKLLLRPSGESEEGNDGNTGHSRR